MSGWIIISRSIKGHWIWKNPERLKWWIDLIIMANFEPATENVKGQRIFCERGQFATTLTDLARGWNADYHVVHRFIRKLMDDGMVDMESNKHWVKISIINYDEYQLNAKPIAKPTDGISVSYEVERKTNRKTKIQIAKPIAKPTQNNLQNQSLENEDVSEVGAKPIAKQTQNQSQPLLKEIKENNIYSSTSIMGAQGEKVFIDELKGSQSWLELMAMRFRLKSIDEVRKRLDDFLLDQTCRGVSHQSLNDARKHFNDWLRIVLSKEQKETENAENRKGSEDKRRGTNVTATSGEDYEGQF